MDRRTFNLSVAAAALSLGTGGSTVTDNPTNDELKYGSGPRRITPRLIDEINEATNQMRGADLQQGGRYEYEAARSAVKRLDRLHEICPLGLKPALLLAHGWRASVVGMKAFDIEEMGAAQTYYNRASSLAKLADNPSLDARVDGQLARMYIYDGAPDLALAVLDRIMDDMRKMALLTPTEKAMLYALRGRAHAAAAEVAAAEAALKTADGHMNNHTTADYDGRPWISHYDQAHHYGDVAAGWGDITRNGGVHGIIEATGCYGLAIGLYDPAATRSWTLASLSLATLDIETGDVDGGVQTGLSALDGAASVESTRVTNHLVKLNTALHLPKVVSYKPADDLRDQVAEVLASAR